MKTDERLRTMGILVLRTGFGFMFLTNGLSKLTGWSGLSPFPGFLINLGGPGSSGGAYGILQYDVQDHPVGLYYDFIHQVVLPGWSVFGPLLTLAELAVGLSLILGLLTPVGALAGALFVLHLNFAVWNRNVWAWEYAVEWIPLMAVALLRAGRFWGLDRRLSRRLPWWPVT